MKKLLALSLAALMVMGLSVTSFADLYEFAPIVSGATQLETGGTYSPERIKGISEYGYLVDDDGLVAINKGEYYESCSDTVAPGDTIYIPLVAEDGGFVTHADAVKSVSVKQSWILGRDTVESVKVVYKKYTGFDSTHETSINASESASGYAYFVAFTMKDSTSTAAKDVSVDLTIKKSSGTLKNSAGTALDLKSEIECRVDVACAYNRMNENKSGSDYLIKSAYQVYDGTDEDGEQTFDFDKDPDSYFEVDVTGQNKLLVRADVKYNATVAAKYPSASLDFFNGSGTFNKIGLLYLAAEEDSYLYVLNSDGTLTASTAEYDGSHFIIKTRTLGSYVISDRELNVDTAPSSSQAPSVEPEAPVPAPSSQPATTGGASTSTSAKVNPGTGAAA